VFGVEADDLVACDLPAPDEVLGCALTQDDVAANLDALRVMDEDGKARRRQ